MKKQITMKNMKKIIKSQNRSLTSLAVELEVSQEAISQYISGKIHPKLETIVKMANLLNTSTDYLLDLTDDPTKPDFIIKLKIIIASTIIILFLDIYYLHFGISRFLSKLYNSSFFKNKYAISTANLFTKLL